MFTQNIFIRLLKLTKHIPSYVSVSVPPLEHLYIDNEISIGSGIIENRWRILSWIMSMSDEMMAAIKKLPKDFLLIATTLYVLVKVI